MFDVTTYLLTQNNAGGPIIELADQSPHDLSNFYDNEGERPAPTLGKAIGGMLSLGGFLTLGVYFYIIL